ncbi:hypothetical protein GCM10009722_38370 [Williamsia deligens]|nr:hypothetical protein [Williamsia deligens]
MHIDCATCPGRPRACGDCIMGVLIPVRSAVISDDGVVTAQDPRAVEVDDIRAAIETLVDAGLVGPSARRSPIVVEKRATVTDLASRRAG